MSSRTSRTCSQLLVNYISPKFILLELGAIAILIIITTLVNWKIIKHGVIFESHDLQYHIKWLQHFSKQLSEGILYPRWLSGTNYGYGSPTFVFYPPLVYYIGSFFKFIGLNAERTTVTLFSLAVFLSSFNFYLFGRNKWNRIASILGAVTYIVFPYIAYNIYNRGALAEAWALVFVPLGLLLTKKAIIQPKWNPILAILFAFLALTHVPSLLLYTIFWFAYIIFSAFKYPIKNILLILFSAAVGFGLASVYLLPAILEKSLVGIAAMKGVKGGFLNNLIGLQADNNTKGHIRSFFTYGLFSGTLFSTAALYIYRDHTKRLKETLCWIAFFLANLFLMSYLSVPVWQTSSILQMVQFPWRLLGLLSFIIASLLSLVTNGVLESKNPLQKMLFLGLIISILFWNMRYTYILSLRYSGFNNPGNLTSAEVKESRKNESFQLIKTALFDPYTNKLKDAHEYYPLLPKTGLPAKKPVIGQPRVSVIKGDTLVKIKRWSSYQRIFNLEAKESSSIRVRTYYYPAWHLYINNQLYPIKISDDGTIKFELKAGSYQANLVYGWTRALILGMITSSLSLILLIIWGYVIYKKINSNVE